MDIAKLKIDVALFIDGKTKNKSFKNALDGFETLTLWLRELGVWRVQACLEATGNYGEKSASYLHEAGYTVRVVNPARINGFAQSELIRTKTDKIDSGIIVWFCLAMKPESWSPPSPKIKSLRAFPYLDRLTANRHEEPGVESAWDSP
jgi:transposase